MVRSRGYLKGLDDLSKVVVGLGDKGTPIFSTFVATLQIGGEARRGVGELDGKGEAVGGVVVARFGANAYQVIEDVKAKLAVLEEGLPPGVFVEKDLRPLGTDPPFDGHARDTLLEEILVVGLVYILFCFICAANWSQSSSCLQVCSRRSWSCTSSASTPTSCRWVGSRSRSESSSTRRSSWSRMRTNIWIEEERVHAGASPTPRFEIILAAAKEVGPQLFFSLLIITVSFLPVFVLGGEAGRLFKPLAYTKTFAMAAAALLSITIIPVLMYAFITARVLPKEWGFARNTLLTLAAMLLPAAVLYVVASDMPTRSPRTAPGSPVVGSS